MKSKFVVGLLALLSFLFALLLTLRRPTAEADALTSLPAQQGETPTSGGSIASESSAALASAAVAPAVKPTPPQAELWNQPVTEPKFAAFVGWVRRYAAAPTAAEKAALESEGVALARVRLTALADMIQSRPARALELAVPDAVRQAMPDRVKPLLEELINARGDYEVVCVLPLPDAQGESESIIRSARLGEAVCRVFTFGPALDYVTRKDVPLHGVAVPAGVATSPPGDRTGLKPAKLMALSPCPARWLDAEAAGADQAALELGGRMYSFATAALAEEWAIHTTAALELDQPEIPANLPAEASSYTEGRKRFLLMRVDFPDYQTDAFPTNNALSLMASFSNFMAEISYYKHIVAAVGDGSDITPVMRMSENASAYDNAGLSKLYPEARRTARDVYGYDLSKYDFFFVCTGGEPSYSYAGLGYVGGVGFHLANSYFNVRTTAHEFGHNLGLGHANWWDNGGASTIGSGTSDEYGDPFDTMGGSGGGDRHFSSHFKNRLGWIPDSDSPTVTSSGFFRLHAHDVATAPLGLRCIRLNRPGANPYVLEFRQLWTGNKAMMNGVCFRWGSGSSILLDMNPGSSGGKDDHPLTIGRTFTDPERNYHITPIGKGHTYPESLDVVINIGSFPGNQPPDVIATASVTSAGPGQSVTFVAQASDANGDPLAYFWDFGDGDYGVDNRAVTTHSFSGTGDYHVECTVSDMKGGVARDSLTITVGSPSTYRISGRVLDAQGRPVVGMRVSTSSSRYAFTESDGSYTISRLGAGTHTVNAVDPVRDSFTFLNPFFSNPVRVGPDFTAADFIATTNSLTVYTPLLPKLSTWRYLDDGSNQGTAWLTPGFNDSGWSSGAGILGYGEGNEATTLSYGSDPNNKHITYYFRTTFNVANTASYTNLLLEVLRDDGVIVYCNGVEVYRNNMPGGSVNHLTMALDALEPDSYLSTTLPAGALVEGANVIAAEIHQADSTSSDINFDLAISGLSVSNIAGLTMVYLSSPSRHDSFLTPGNVPITAYAQGMMGPASLVEFYAGGTKIGQDTTAPFSTVWLNPPAGAHTLRAVATFGSDLVTSAPLSISVNRPDASPPPVSLNLIPTGATWKYLAGPSAAPSAWAAPGFDDSAWPAGVAELGNGDSGEGRPETTPINIGPSNNRYATIYFRHAFVVNDPSAATNLEVRLLRDDGAVVHLNGVELFRSNMPEGPVAYGTLAEDAVANADESTFYLFSLPAPALWPGTNVLAVEVHQSALGSSDLSFDLGLDALASTNRSRGVWISTPGAGTTIPLPGEVAISADVVAGGTLGVTKVEFYSDAIKIGEAVNVPFAFTWNNPPGGAHQITAVATDTAGSTIASAPVSITVLPPPLSTALVSFGDVWKYRDDGSNQGSNWTALAFNDAAWRVGASRFGYGNDGEITTLSYGPDYSRKHITYYFRKAFTVADPAAFDGLHVQLIRDDGAVVYLNGREVHRDNLQDGLVTFNSLAVNVVNPPEETTPFRMLLDAGDLVAGTNVLAVEVHQANIGSSDVGFDLALFGLAATNPASGLYLTSPAIGQHFHAPARIALASYANAAGDGVSLVEYFAGLTKIGQSAAYPYEVTWNNAPEGAHTLTARALLESGSRLTSAPVAIVIGSPPPPIAPVFETFIAALSDWKYWDNVAPLSADWAQPGYDDNLWPAGPARLGWGYDGERTILTEGRITHYFRRWFHVTDPGQITHLIFQLARDDGAVVYLNGLEVFRSNMPAEPVTRNTLASTTINTPDETSYFETIIPTAGSGLVEGGNVVAVELHQASANSSDGGFDLQLLGSGTTEGRVYFASPNNGVTYSLSDTIRIEAVAWTGSTASVSRMEFFVDGVKLSESLAPPYRYFWSNLPPRTHTLTACATDTLGRVLVSAPLDVVVSLPLGTNTFITRGSAWKYLDDGSNQGTSWAQPDYDDSTWSNGVARFGYGDDGEVTTVRFGPYSNNKYITTYFRKLFVVPPGLTYTNLAVHLLRDDGAVVWLNGRELFRSNMSEETPVIGYRTVALSQIGGAAEQTFYERNMPAALLVQGTNVLAVEVHQGAANSSDLSFDLELFATGFTDDAAPVELEVELDGGIVSLSWPETAYGYRLFVTTNLSAGGSDWIPVDAGPAKARGRNMVVLPASGSSRLFRLGRP